jgi:hypothetical protein
LVTFPSVPMKLFHVWWVAGAETGHYVVRKANEEDALAEAQSKYRVTKIGRHTVIWHSEELSNAEGLLLEILDWI